MIDLSIIIPVYNLAGRMERCFQSLLDSSLCQEKYEIIAVNDGSSDDSLIQLEIFQKQFCNFTIVTQENQGLSCARNAGLQQSKGKYIWFLDGDDWIESAAIKPCLDRALENSVDVLIFNLQTVDDDGNMRMIKPMSSCYGAVYSAEEFIQLGGSYIPSACVSFYRTAFLKTKRLVFATLSTVRLSHCLVSWLHCSKTTKLLKAS